MMRLQLLLRAEKLPCKSTWNKKSPNALATVSDMLNVGSVMGVTRKLIGRTEIVPQTANPEWATVITISHTSGTQHRLSIDVFDNKAYDEQDCASVYKKRSDQQISEHEPEQLCGIIVDVETILSKKDHELTEGIPGSSGKIHIKLEQSLLPPVSSIVGPIHFRFQFRGYKCTNTRLALLNLDRPDFFVEIRRKQKGVSQNTWGLVYRSKRCKSTLNPLWDKDRMDIEVLCNYDYNREIRISIVDRDSQGKRTWLGSCDTTMKDLMDSVAVRGNLDRDMAFALVRVDDMKKKQKRGELVVLQAEINGDNGEYSSTSLSSPRGSHTSHTMMASPRSSTRSSVTSIRSSVNSQTTAAESVQVLPPPAVASSSPRAVRVLQPPQREPSVPTALAVSISEARYTLDDYVGSASSRCQLNMCVAIDFTNHHGTHKNQGSTSTPSLNDYEWVMSVMDLALSPYQVNTDYPVFGFGAATMNGRRQQHVHEIFQCGPSKTANGANGLVKAYQTFFKTGLECSNYRIGYNKIIQASAAHARTVMHEAQQQQQLAYTVLLILTTGSTKDILEAKQTIESVSNEPVSIIFVKMDGDNNNGGGSSRSDTWDDVKLDVQLTRNGCRSFCSFLQTSQFSNPRRNSQGLATSAIARLEENIPTYFLAQSIYPTV